MRPSVRIATPARRMSVRDAGFLYLEQPHCPIHIGCVAVLEGQATPDDLAPRIEARLTRTPRYGQRALDVPFGVAHPTWEDDPRVDVRSHLHRWALPSPGGEAELHDTIAQLLMLPLDRSRPLWEMHVLSGLQGGRTAILQKVHHCMIDGIAGVHLLEGLFGVKATARPPRSELRVVPPPLPGPRAQLGRAVTNNLARAAEVVGRAARGLVSPSAARSAAQSLREAYDSARHLATNGVPHLPWNAPVGCRRRVALTRLPFEGVRRVRAVQGGTVNDVVLACLAGGLRRYLDAGGHSTSGFEPTALVPVNLRAPADAAALGNRISAMLVPLAVDSPDDLAGLAATRVISERLKTRAAWAGIDAVLTALEGLPAPLVARLARGLQPGRLANVIATNVPGPRETRYLGRSRVEALYPIVPLVDGIGLSLAVFSYDGWLHVGLNADADLVPDLSKLLHGIEDAFSHLVAST